MQAVARVSARRMSGLSRLAIWVFGTLFGFVVSVAAWDFVTSLLSRNNILGWIALALVSAALALLLLLALREAAAFARPCPTYGQRVEAAVRLSDGAKSTEADLIALCISKVGPFKSPDRVHLMAELPKGPSGKIQRLKLAEML